METYQIHNEQDYRAALRAISPMFDNQPESNTPEGDFFDAMVLLVETYEAEHYPIEPPDPIEARKFRMNQIGFTTKDL